MTSKKKQSSKKSIDSLRRQIDAVDSKIVSLLSRRAKIVVKIGAWKRANRIPIVNLAREKVVLKNILKSDPGLMAPAAMKRIFQTIINESRRIQKGQTEAKPRQKARSS